jgi:AcrR family transcriptional regulator
VERLGTADYFREATAILEDEGGEALTVAELCERLAVTKGSFYHHFGAMPTFVSQFLGYWEAERGKRLVAVSRAKPDPGTRIRMLMDAAIDLPHGSEASIRAWSRTNPDVAAAIARVDRRRERHFVDAITGVGVDRRRARVLGRLAVDVLVGEQQREDPVDVKRLRQSFDEVKRLISLDADPRLVAALAATPVV